MVRAISRWMYSEVPDLDPALDSIRSVYQGLAGYQKCIGFLAEDINALGICRQDSVDKLGIVRAGGGNYFETERAFFLHSERYERAGGFYAPHASSDTVLYNIYNLLERAKTRLADCKNQCKGRAAPFAARLNISLPDSNWRLLDHHPENTRGRIPDPDPLIEGLRSYHRTLDEPIETVASVLHDMEQLKKQLLFRRGVIADCIGGAIILTLIGIVGATYLYQHRR